MIKRGLAATLEQLVKDAEDKPETARRLPLRNGLRIDVMLTGEQLHLQISRENTYPSDVEWRTVLRAWPYAVQVTPTRLEHGGRFWLRANWQHIRERQTTLA